MNMTLRALLGATVSLTLTGAALAETTITVATVNPTVTTGNVRTVFIRSRLNQRKKNSCRACTLFQSGLVKSGKTKSPNIAEK